MKSVVAVLALFASAAFAATPVGTIGGEPDDLVQLYEGHTVHQLCVGTDGWQAATYTLRRSAPTGAGVVIRGCWRMDRSDATVQVIFEDGDAGKIVASAMKWAPGYPR
jgi:hypothetical protein